MMNLNVDQNGIPYKGFIKADKIRAQKERERYAAAAARIAKEAAKGESPKRTALIKLLGSPKITMIGVISLILLSSTVAYLAGEMRGSARESLEMTAVTLAVADELSVLRNEIEQEKRDISREIVQQKITEQELIRQETMQKETIQKETIQKEAIQQNMEQITKQSLSRLKQSLEPQNANIQLKINTGTMDAYSLSLSDPLSGHAVNQSDSELEKLRLRVISMIDTQPETSLIDQ